MMRKIKFVFSIVIVLTAIISAALGYFAAYYRGLSNMYYTHGMTYCRILLIQSGSIVRKIDSSGVNGLIDAMEQNGDNCVSIVEAWQPYCRAKDKKTFSLALERWETAKKKLEELRSSILDN